MVLISLKIHMDSVEKLLTIIVKIKEMVGQESHECRFLFYYFIWIKLIRNLILLIKLISYIYINFPSLNTNHYKITQK